MPSFHEHVESVYLVVQCSEPSIQRLLGRLGKCCLKGWNLKHVNSCYRYDLLRCTHVILPRQVNIQLKSGPTLEASYAVLLVITSGPVRLPLRSSPKNLSISGFVSQLSIPDEWKPCGDQVLPLFNIFACRCHYSGSPDRCNFLLLPDQLWPSPKS